MKTPLFPKPRRLTAGLSSLLLGSLLAGPALAGELNLPQWTLLFNPDGTLKDAVSVDGIPDAADYGLGAMFVEDNISGGWALDMSALVPADRYENTVVYNDVISPAHDLGNLYLYAESDAAGALMVYAGVERLAPMAGEAADSYVEFELNQSSVQVYGADQPISGERLAGDLLVRVNLGSDGAASIELMRWESGDAAGYRLVDSGSGPAGDGCGGLAGSYLVCQGALQAGLAPTNADIWDVAGYPVSVTPADSFLQMGVATGQLEGVATDFTSLVVRTPQDVAFAYLHGSVRNIAYWR